MAARTVAVRVAQRDVVMQVIGAQLGPEFGLRDTLVPLCGGHLRYQLGPDRRPRDGFALITYVQWLGTTYTEGSSTP